ncbi:MAG: hypothetical protein CFE21_17295 [Bacteroidetes bacterium B1(2017)]|nr:MAG: hypothetical protein CFE21_17295 [Bacteroidetes bacterium B1(2017)]
MIQKIKYRVYKECFSYKQQDSKKSRKKHGVAWHSMGGRCASLGMVKAALKKENLQKKDHHAPRSGLFLFCSAKRLTMP